MTLHLIPQNFLIFEENFIYFFISVLPQTQPITTASAAQTYRHGQQELSLERCPTQEVGSIIAA